MKGPTFSPMRAELRASPCRAAATGHRPPGRASERGAYSMNALAPTRRRWRPLMILATAAAALALLAGYALTTPGRSLAATAADDDWSEVQGILGGIQGKAAAPIGNVTTPKFTPGMLLGNGDLGVVAGGDRNTNQRFYFGKNDFWGSAWNSGHSQLVTAILSLGNLTISSSATSPDPGPAYRMTQDILNAEVRSTVQLGGATVNMRSYTADSDNTFVTELSSSAGSPAVPVTVALAMPAKD